MEEKYLHHEVSLKKRKQIDSVGLFPKRKTIIYSLKAAIQNIL
jgi:hypothetical protein